jgi:hypothetical protein
MKRFDKDGRLIIPLSQRDENITPQKESGVRYVIKEAFCPEGCNIIDPAYELNGVPGLRIRFKRKGMEGEFVISAIEGDFDKIILSGELKKGVKDELYCPHCEAMFKKLVNCNCIPGADMVVIGLTPELDYNNSVTFCNVTGCENGSFVSSGDVIRHIRLKGTTGY